VNILLTIAKISAGIVGRSSAMIADGVHSFSDISTDIAVIFGLKVAEKPRDETHDFGHGKFETLVAAFIGLFLIGVSGGIIYSSGRGIIDFIDGEVPERPGWIAVVAALLSIILKEMVFWYTLKISKKIGSKALKANAWHHRTDSLSSIAVLIGVGGAIILGGKWTILDPIAALVVSVLIVKVAWDLLKDALMELSEASLDKGTEDRIMSIIKSVRGANDPHNLRTRNIGSDIAIDVHIKAPGNLPLNQAHEISLEVENRLREEFGEDTFVHVHMDPQNVQEMSRKDFYSIIDDHA
jgi:cation diffusion facilitator family transporter